MRSVNRVLLQHAHALHQGIYYYIAGPDLSIQEIAIDGQCQIVMIKIIRNELVC